MGSIHRILSVIFVALITLSFSLTTKTTNSAPNEIINQNLSGLMQPWGSVEKYKISPDSNYVVFIADKDHDEMFELYSVPILGGTPIKLNEPFPINSYSDVESFQISSDSKYVVYSADPPNNNNNITQIYSVPIHGGTPVNLNGDLVEWGIVHSFEISPDGKRVVFIADKETFRKRALYSTSIIGGALTNLTPNITTNIGFREYKISPNSDRVIYIADQDTNNVYELYSVPINGGATTKLNSHLVTDGDVSSFRISPDNKHVVYLADQQIDTVNEIYSVSLAGGTPTKLNNDLEIGHSIREIDYEIAPNSNHVVFVGNGLYSISITGGVPTRLDNGAAGVGIFHISPDSQYIVFSSSNGLSSVNLLGGTPIKLDLKLDGGSWGYPTISPGSSHVVFKYYPYHSNPNSAPYEVRSTSITGGTPIKISTTLDEVLNISFYRISPDNSHVYYVTHRRSDRLESRNLYRVPINGGSSLKLNAEENEYSDIYALEISPNSRYAVYNYLKIDRGYELFVTYDNSFLTYKLYLPTIVH